MNKLPAALQSVLVVDANPLHQDVLSQFFKLFAINTAIATSGVEALKLLHTIQPNIVFLASELDDISLEHIIPSLAPEVESATPIFVTAASVSEELIIQALNYGAYDVIALPISDTLLHAKLSALKSHYDQNYLLSNFSLASQKKEVEFNQRLINEAIDARNFGVNIIDALHLQAQESRNDIYVSAQCPNGDINLFIGSLLHSQGAFGFIALPIVETFRTMSKKGFPLVHIITELNLQLLDVLPESIPLRVGVINLSSQKKNVQVLNAGLPSIKVLDFNNRVKHIIEPSSYLIGQSKKYSEKISLINLPINDNDKLLIFSDGINQLKDNQYHLIDRITKCCGEEPLSSIMNRWISKLTAEFSFTQDISILNVPCGGWDDLHILNHNDDNRYYENTRENASLINPVAWEFSFKLEKETISTINPIPILLNVLKDSNVNIIDWQNLFTVLTELYNNALDHGVLKLNETMSSSNALKKEDIKKERINQLSSGYIKIQIQCLKQPQGDVIVIRVKDSGDGFDVNKYLSALKSHSDSEFAEPYLIEQGTIFFDDSLDIEQTVPRGIELLHQLCNFVEYKQRGTLVEVHYLCNSH